MEDHQPLKSEATASPAAPAERSPYRAPLLRAHGALRDLTLQSKSGDVQKSDRYSKENLVPVAWD